MKTRTASLNLLAIPSTLALPLLVVLVSGVSTRLTAAAQEPEAGRASAPRAEVPAAQPGGSPILPPSTGSTAPPGGLVVSPGGGEAAEILSATVPEGLDELLALTLASSPEILEAEAKVRQARARWNQTRLRVAQEIIGAYHEREVLRSTIALRLGALQGAKARADTGQAPAAVVEEATSAYIEARGRLEQLQARIRYLAGIGAAMGPREPESGVLAPPGTSPGTAGAGAGPVAPGVGFSAGRIQEVQAPAPRRPPLPERLRETLAKAMSADFEQVPLADVLQQLQAVTGTDPPFVVDQQFDVGATPVTLRLSKTSVGGVLSAIHDLTDICFVVRDYGILVAISDRAMTLPGPAIPEDLPLYGH